MWDDIGEIHVVYYTGWDLVITVDKNDSEMYRMTADIAPDSEYFRDGFIKRNEWSNDQSFMWNEMEEFVYKYIDYADTWDDVLEEIEMNDRFTEITNVLHYE